jgi:hypothetical protein
LRKQELTAPIEGQKRLLGVIIGTKGQDDLIWFYYVLGIAVELFSGRSKISPLRIIANHFF